MRKRWMAFVLFFCLFFHPMAMGEGDVQALIFSWWGDETVSQATQAAVEQFEKSIRQRVAIQPQAWGTRDAYEKWLAAQWDTNTPGDVVMLDAEMLRTMARGGNGLFRLRDMETFLDQIDLSQFSYLGLVGCVVEGRLCAIPVGLSSHVFFWNATALKQSKWKPPASEGDLFTLAGVLGVENGAYPLAAGAESRIAFMVTYLQSKYGVPWIDEKERAVGFTAEQVAEGLRYLDRMEKAHVWPKLSEQGDLIEGWREGRYLGIWAWDSLAVELNASIPENGKMEVAARLSGWTPYGGGFQKVTRMLAIPQAAGASKDGARLIHYLLNEDKGVRALAGSWGMLDSESGGTVTRRSQLVDGVISLANKTALSWARYPMPMGFEAPALVGPGGIYEQVLTGYSEGLMTDEAAAAALMSGLKVALQ